VWRYTYTPQYTFMAWCLVKAQGQLYLYIYVFEEFIKYNNEVMILSCILVTRRKHIGYLVFTGFASRTTFLRGSYRAFVFFFMYY